MGATSSVFLSKWPMYAWVVSENCVLCESAVSIKNKTSGSVAIIATALSFAVGGSELLSVTVSGTAVGTASAVPVWLLGSGEAHAHAITASINTDSIPRDIEVITLDSCFIVGCTPIVGCTCNDVRF